MAETEVDQPIEERTDQVIAAIAVVVAEQVASQGAEDTDDTVAGWISLLRGTAGLVLDAFLASSLVVFVTALRGSPASRVDVQKYVESAREQVLAEAAEAVTNRARPADPSLPGRVARLMVLGSRELSRFEAASDAGAVYKVWRSRRDTRVRPTHGGLEGNRVPIGQPFVTAEGNSLMHPHDPTAPLSETAGCRCRLSYRIEVAA